MSKSYNRTIIIGRLGANPIEKNGCAVFPILNTTWDAENHKDEVQCHKVWTSGKQTPLVMRHLNKGDLCCIEGSLTNTDGKVSIHAERITFLSAKKSSEVASQESN